MRLAEGAGWRRGRKQASSSHMPLVLSPSLPSALLLLLLRCSCILSVRQQQRPPPQCAKCSLLPSQPKSAFPTRRRRAGFQSSETLREILHPTVCHTKRDRNINNPGWGHVSGFLATVRSICNQSSGPGTSSHFAVQPGRSCVTGLWKNTPAVTLAPCSL